MTTPVRSISHRSIVNVNCTRWNPLRRINNTPSPITGMFWARGVRLGLLLDSRCFRVSRSPLKDVAAETENCQVHTAR